MRWNLSTFAFKKFPLVSSKCKNFPTVVYSTTPWGLLKLVSLGTFHNNEEKKYSFQPVHLPFPLFFPSWDLFEFPTYSNGTLWMCFFLKSWNLLNIITNRYWTGLFLRNYQHAIPFSILGNSLNYPWILFFSPSLNNEDGYILLLRNSFFWSPRK